MSVIVRPRGRHGQNGQPSNDELLAELRRQLVGGDQLFKRLESLREYAVEVTQLLRDANGAERYSEKSIHRLIRSVEHDGLKGGRPKKERRTA